MTDTAIQIDLEQTLARLLRDFIESTRDKLDGIDEAIDAIYKDAENRGELFFGLQRDVHSLKGSAGTYGFPSVTLIAHRLEDYMESTRRLSHESWLEVQVFIDVIRSIIDTGVEPSKDGRTAILSQLPTTGGAVSGQNQHKVTILLVMPQGVQRSLVGSELSSCGFDISFAETPYEAINLAITLQPQAVVSSYEFAGINGCEFAQVLQVIKATAEIPFALITSHAANSVAINTIPLDVRVIPKGPKSVELVTKYLVELGLSEAAGRKA